MNYFEKQLAEATTPEEKHSARAALERWTYENSDPDKTDDEFE